MKCLSEITSDEIDGVVNRLMSLVDQLDGYGLLVEDSGMVGEAIQEIVLFDPLPWITTKEVDGE